MSSRATFTGQSGTIWEYWTDRPLGKRGGFGRVYAGQGHDGIQVAVKVIMKHDFSGLIDTRLLRREIDIGRRVSESGSTTLLPVIDAAETEWALLLVILRAKGSLAAVAR